MASAPADLQFVDHNLAATGDRGYRPHNVCFSRSNLKACFGEAPKPTREARVLPRVRKSVIGDQ